MDAYDERCPKRNQRKRVDILQENCDRMEAHIEHLKSDRDKWRRRAEAAQHILSRLAVQYPFNLPMVLRVINQDHILTEKRR
jgi:hypothetical protein